MPGNPKRFKHDPSGTTTVAMSDPLTTTVDSSLGSSVVADAHDVVLNINNLPPEILIKIFGYITHNDLGRVARVCKKWMMCSRYPFLWKKVDVKFLRSTESQTQVAAKLFKNLPNCVTLLKLEFWLGCGNADDRLNLETLCVILKERCPNLQELILYYAEVPVSLESVINLFADFLPNLLKLEFRSCNFEDVIQYAYTRHGGISKIEILSIYRCKVYKDGSSFSKMPFLKRLVLAEIDELTFGYLFWMNNSLLKQLEVLNLQGTPISSLILMAVKLRSIKLTQLCMSRARFPRQRCSFTNFNLPCVKEICLLDCQNVTSADIVALIQSCSSLQDVYVHEGLAQSYAVNPSVVSGQCQLDIVKSINKCPHN